MQIELDSVAKLYTNGWVSTCALREITLGIAKGEFVAVSGPSGAGKSTLLKIIGCLERPTSGMYRFDGREVQDISRSLQARVRGEKVGFLFEHSNLIEDLTVGQNVEIPLVLRGIPSPQRRELVEQALDRVGLQDRIKHLPGYLSSGPQQKVALARALVGQPELVIVDEPTGRLDTRSGSELMEMIVQVNRSGATVVMATHDADLADLADRIIDLVDGRMMT